MKISHEKVICYCGFEHGTADCQRRQPTVATRPTGNDLHLRAVSPEATVTVLHHDSSSLREILVKQRINGIDAPPQRVEAQVTPVMNDCRPLVHRGVQRRCAYK